jgi:purine-binding chemotaxis protein CheW
MAGETIQLLRFKVGHEIFALPIQRVVQIIDRRQSTRVPSVASWVMGVFNHDGAITPLIDLRSRFAVDEETTDPGTKCIVIVAASHEHKQVSVGLLTDGVVDVADVGRDQIEEPPGLIDRMHVEYLGGLTKIGDSFTLVIDVNRFLDAETLLGSAESRVEAYA